MKNIFFALVTMCTAITLSTGFSSCKKNTDDITTQPKDSINNYDTVIITPLIIDTVETTADQIVSANDTIGNFDICSGTQKSTLTGWTTVYPSTQYSLSKGSVHTFIGLPQQQTEYKINIHAIQGQFAVSFAWKIMSTGEHKIEETSFHNSTSNGTYTKVFTKYDIPLGAHVVIVLYPITNLDFYHASYLRNFEEKHRVNMSNYKHVYQNYLPVSYANDAMFSNENISDGYPFYSGTYQFITTTTNLCGLAAYMVATNLVDGASGITNLKNTKQDRAIQLAEKIQRVQTIVQDQNKIGSYSIYDLFRLAAGTPSAKGDFAWPYQSINYYDCNSNGVYDDYQGETCKAQMINNVTGSQSAHYLIQSSIESGYPVICPIKSRVLGSNHGYPNKPHDYLLGNNRANHIVTIVGVDVTESGSIYYRYIDPVFDDDTVWFAEKSVFLQSMRDNGSNSRYDMLIIKGHS